MQPDIGFASIAKSDMLEQSETKEREVAHGLDKRAGQGCRYLRSAPGEGLQVYFSGTTKDPRNLAI
jgi:hypothetical protein